MSFKPGDIVVLKSGGPFMTVEWVQMDEIKQVETAACVWFEPVGERQVHQSAVFATITLEPHNATADFLVT